MTCCPSAERLGRFLDGRDDDPGRDAVEDHVEGCAACREALERLTGGSLHPTLPRLAGAIRGLDRRAGVPPAEATQPEAAGSLPPSGRGDGPRSPAAASRYVRVRHLERGGLGLVSVAVDTELNREVVFKEILPEQADRPQSRARFLLEAAVTARLEHPGIVPVYGQGVTDRGHPFYAMRFVRGESLKRAVERFHSRDVAGDPSARSLAFRDLLRRFIDVCNTIAYAHDRGVLHRDLKPSNILLGPFGETVVIDWGLAKLVGSVGDDPAAEPAAPLRPIDRLTCETVVGAAIGSPSYMSPEQADGRSDSAGTACDIYGLGATLYAILSGKPPREGGDVQRVLDAARSGAFPPPRAVNRDVPPALEAVCLKAMARRPDDRYGSARALAEDVERWLAGEPVSAWREPWPVRLGRAFDRYRTAAVASAAALLVAMLAAGYLAYGARIREGESRARAEGWVRTLEMAETHLLPQILRQLGPDRRWVDPLLAGRLGRPANDKERLHFALALAREDRDPSRLDWLADRLLGADPTELRVICEVLGDRHAALIPRLGEVLVDPRVPAARRFRAAGGLAILDPPRGPDDLARWGPYAGTIVDQAMAAVLANPRDLEPLVRTLRPLRRIVFDPLLAHYRRRQVTHSDRRAAAAGFLREYVDRPDELAALLPYANPGEIEGWLLRLSGTIEDALGALSGAARPAGLAEDSDPEPSWELPDPKSVRAVERAHGLLARDFALCQTMPVDDFVGAADALARAGYRPTCVRPYDSGESTAVAAVWARDGGPWRLDSAVDPADIRQRVEARRREGFRPSDVGSSTRPSGRRAFLLLYDRGGADARVECDILRPRLQDQLARLIAGRWRPIRLQRDVAPGTDGRPIATSHLIAVKSSRVINDWSFGPVHSAFNSRPIDISIHCSGNRHTITVITDGGGAASSAVSYGLVPSLHLLHARVLAALGLRPVAIAAGHPDGRPEPVTASIWSRPPRPGNSRIPPTPATVAATDAGRAPED